MATEAFDLATAEDERAELAALGVHLERPLSDPELDATASLVLREIAETEADLERHDQALQAEIAMLRARYERLTARARARSVRLHGVAMEIARRMDFGKKKSRAVGYGVIGFRTKPEHLSIEDDAAALAWARTHAPELVEIRTVEKLPQKKLAGYFAATGDLPPGCAWVPAIEEFYVKPDTAARERAGAAE